MFIRTVNRNTAKEKEKKELEEGERKKTTRIQKMFPYVGYN